MRWKIRLFSKRPPLNPNRGLASSQKNKPAFKKLIYMPVNMKYKALSSNLGCLSWHQPYYYEVTTKEEYFSSAEAFFLKWQL